LLNLWPFGRRLLIEDAARFAYEAAERAGVLDLVTSGESPPGVRLNHFKYVFMVDDEVVLYGVKPPSTQSFPIPREQYSQLCPVEGESRLDKLAPRKIVYVDVTIGRQDLRRIIQEYPAKAREFGKLARR
jgi:hypothetical protein